jgi:hypothetical protein
MPKVFGLHEIELRPGVDPAEYERVFAEEVASSPTLPGWRASLLKGDRGARAGKFLVLIEMDSVEARDRYFPEPDSESEEFRRFMEQHPDAAAALQKLWTLESRPDNVTDYVVVVE